METERNQTFVQLVTKTEEYFKNLSYSSNRLCTFRMGWRILETFMKENSMSSYNSTVGEKFIENVLGTSSYAQLNKRKKDIIRSINVLTEYQTTGTVKFRSVLKTYKFKGEIGEIIIKFLSYRKSIGLSKDTIDINRLYLHRFLEYLETNDVNIILDIDRDHVLGFINSLGFYSKATIHCMLPPLRIFLKYLQDNCHTHTDLSYLVPKSSYKKAPHLPTTYEKDEIERLIQAVDRANPKGKRDIAMILLAARLGLRASDICNLKFENINWQTSIISLTQHKTKERIELPLLIDVGNSIIDYLKYGRPVSNLPYIFIRLYQPYYKLEEPTLHSIVSFYLKRAGIQNLNKRKHGPHALRHSLAGFLLEKKTPLPVISEVLGHANTESTKTYLRIDLESLKQCSLDVPPIKSPYYQGVL